MEIWPNGSNPDITDKNGILLTPEQYLAKRIDPFYNAATFYNQTSDTTYGAAWKAQLALAQKTTANNTQRKQAIDNLTYKGTPVPCLLFLFFAFFVSVP